MKLIYLHQYFLTPDEYGSTRSYWLSRKLAKNNHQVSILSALSSSSKRERGEHEIEGFHVSFIGGRYSNLLSKTAKVSLFLKYLLFATFRLFKEKNIDLIFATSTPITAGIPALILKKIKSVPYVFEVRDLWPEFPVQIGVIKNPVLIKIVKWLEKQIYLNASHIIALSPGMKAGIEEAGISAEKITVIPNMSKPDLFYPRPLNTKLAQEYNINLTCFNIIHFGAMGPANGLDFVIEMATYLKSMRDCHVVFILAGYGAAEMGLKEKVKHYKLDNVLFVGKHNTYTIAELVNLCDASLVSFKPLPVLDTNSPNKLFDSLSAGKPILVNSRGWTKDLVENEHCGIYLDRDDIPNACKKIIALSKNNILLDKMSRNSRRLAEEKFDKDILTTQLRKLLEDVYGNIKNQQL